MPLVSVMLFSTIGARKHLDSRDSKTHAQGSH